MRLTPPVTACLNCGRPITTTPGKRAKLYCDPSCKSNYRQKQQRLAKKAAAPLPADYVDTNESGIAILLPNGKKEKINVGDTIGNRKVTKVKRTKSGTTVTAKVELNDLTKPTGKKVVSDPPPKTNFTIAMPVRKKGEDAFDFAARKNEWKRKQK